MTVRTEYDPGDLEPRRRYGRVALLVACLVAGMSAAGLWAVWRLAGHHGGSAGVPIIRADDRPVKVPPANPGGMKVPDQDLYVLNQRQPKDSKVEQLLPPPETPLPRPVPPPEPAVAAAPPETVAAPAANPAPMAAAPSAPAVAAPSPQPAPPAAAPAIAAAAAPPAAAPAPTPPASADKPAAAAAAAVMPVAPPLALKERQASARGYRLQVGAMRSAELAQHEWARLKHAQPDILGALDVRTVRVALAGRGVFYRIEAGPITDEAAARRDCDTLKQRKVGCILVRP